MQVKLRREARRFQGQEVVHAVHRVVGDVRQHTTETLSAQACLASDSLKANE